MRETSGLLMAALLLVAGVRGAGAGGTAPSTCATTRAT